MKSIDKKQAESISNKIREEIGAETAITIYNGRKPIPRGTPDFTMIFQVINVTLSKILKPATCKILLYFLGKAEYGNFIPINVETIMEELEISESSVIRGIKQLQETHIIITTKDLGDKRRNVYFLNPHHSWRGTWKKRIEIMKKAPKEQLSLTFE